MSKFIDDNKTNPPLHYYKSDYELVKEKLQYWRWMSGALFIIIVVLMAVGVVR